MGPVAVGNSLLVSGIVYGPCQVLRLLPDFITSAGG